MKKKEFINKNLQFLKEELVKAREKELPLKWFFTKIREFKQESKTEILDIGSTITPSNRVSSFLFEILDKVHQFCKENEIYFHYSSSWGLLKLRHSICDFMKKKYNLSLDPSKEIFITRGIVDSYDRLLKAFRWKGIIIPHWSPYFFVSKAIFYQIPILRIPIELKTGNLILEGAERKIKEIGGNWLLVLNHPIFPMGLVATKDFIEKKLFPFCKKNKVYIFCETYLTTRKINGQPLFPLLSYKNLKDVCVESVSLHREIGVGGIRVGWLMGNEHLINGIRILASSEVEIVPPMFQIAASFILDNFLEIKEKEEKNLLKELKNEIFPRLKKMNWPFIPPKAGISMVAKVPNSFKGKDIQDPSLFASFVFLKRYGVALAPCSSFSPEGKNWLLIELKQKDGKVKEALDRMRTLGFDWKKIQPTKEEKETFKREIQNFNKDQLFFLI